MKANAHVVLNNMKKIYLIVLFLFFLILTVMIISCPVITQWDRSFIIFIQEHLAFLPLTIPMLPDCALYIVMIALPLVCGGIFFVKNKRWTDLICLFSIPLVTFMFNCILKPLVRRSRPPLELQISSIHPDSFSYVSSHSLVTFCLWAMVIRYLHKYCRNRILRYTGYTVAVLWILFVGLSRVWLGVHNSTDVLGAYILGLILVIFYIKIIPQMEKYVVKKLPKLK